MNEPAKKKTLTEITDELQQLLWRVDDAQGELTEELEAELDDCEAALEEKVNAILWVTDQQEAMADKMQARARALTAKAKSIERDRERLRQYLLHTLIRLGIDKMSTRDYPVVAVYNSPDKVEVTDEEYFMAKHRDDKVLCKHEERWKPKLAAIKDALQHGVRIAGAALVTDRKRLGVK
jgi:hypothetical protein